MVCQNVLILGKSGSGKTSGAGDYLLRRLVRYRNSSGLILAAKFEDKKAVQRIFREERSLGDLLILEPGGQLRLNILDHEMQRGARPADLTQLLLLLSETMDRMEGSGHGGDSFFRSKARQGLDHAIALLTRATGKLDPWALQCFISGAAMSLEELNDPQWQQSFHAQVLADAEANCTTDIQRHDIAAATQYWKSTWPRMNDRTRTSIEAHIDSPLHTFNTGIVRDLLATSTSVTPGLLEKERKWLLLNAPITPGDATATFLNAAVKLCFQKYVLSREANPGDPLLCLWADECQLHANSFDRAYVEACRSRIACYVALTQSAHALYSRIGGKGGEHETDALLTNFGHVICHTLGDHKTAEHFSSLLGKCREGFVSPTIPSGPDDLYDAIVWGKSGISVSASESYQPVLQPAAFLSGLRCGGPPDNVVDAIVIRSGLKFNASRENYLFTRFRQR
jgi:hypothetical protein